MAKQAIYYDLDKDITCIDTQYTRKNFAASYLIKADNEYAFVDTGTNLSVPILLATLAIKNIATTQVKYIFTTHIHLDHAGGAGGLLKHLPEAKVVVHKKGAKHLINPEKLKSAVISVYGELFFRQNFGDIIPIAKDRIIIAKNSDIYLANRKLSLIDTKGHANHHYCIYDELSQGIFSGDTLGVSYREFDSIDGISIFPPTTPNQFSPEIWQKTIDELMCYKPKYAYLTHFNRISFNNYVARVLKKEIINFANIAKKSVIITDNDEKKYKKIRQNLTKHLLANLKHKKLSINEEEQKYLLKSDIRVCTKGLMVWLEQQKTAGK